MCFEEEAYINTILHIPRILLIIPVILTQPLVKWTISVYCNKQWQKIATCTNILKNIIINVPGTIDKKQVLHSLSNMPMELTR